jgi:ribosomal-protein-alanine acetyltransferase
MMNLAAPSPFAAKWSSQQYERLLRRDDAQQNDQTPRLVLVIEEEPTAVAPAQTGTPIAGFLVAEGVQAEWELQNLVVSESRHRRGLGSQLMRELLSRLCKQGAFAVFLEVRAANLAARALYEKFLFQETGLRRDYYHEPADDAVLYNLYLL